MNRPSILVVDDESGMLKSMSRLLKEDFHVFTASNGEEGLFIFGDRPLSLILLDLDMPVMNGLETLKRIREICNKTSVIIMTGRSSHEWAKKCADLNIQGYIEKPFDPMDLIGRIKGLLGMEDSSVLRKLWGDSYDARMSVASPTFKKAVRFVSRNLKRSVTREEVAAHLDITPAYLSRLFRKECGVGLKEYINSCKIEESMKCLVNNPHLPLSDIAASVGIGDVNYFCRLFKKQTGLPPGEFRKKSLSS